MWLLHRGVGIAPGNALEISSTSNRNKVRVGVEEVMGKQRKTWTVEEKLTLILAALREEQSVAQLARQHGVSEQPIYRWKAPFLDGGCQALGGAKTPRADQRLQSENEQLKRLLGEKTLEIDLLKKLSSL
jgi:putative transposase